MSETVPPPELIIDWANDEEVVTGAIPDAKVVRRVYGKTAIYSRLHYASTGVGFFAFSASPSSDEYRFNLNAEAWFSARNHPTVQAFERLHNPCREGITR